MNKIALNGLGRIGRLVLRHSPAHPLSWRKEKMKRSYSTRVSLILLTWISLAVVDPGAIQPSMAQETPKEPSAVGQPGPVKKTEKEIPAEKVSLTRHSIELNGQTLKYTAAAGYMLLKDESGKPKGNLFFVAYTRNPGEDPYRPVTFAFNGGPGASSIWLHLGALGPQRVPMTDAGEVSTPPYQPVPNELTWLEFTDLVFIDPVGTGYSRPAPGVDPKEFYGVEKDIQSVGEFIRLYLTRYNRWRSPKFLAGESYGTTRAAGLAGYLQDRFGLDLNGVILISAVLNFQTLVFQPGNDLPYLLYLPPYTAAAFYHQKLSPDLQSDLRKTLHSVEQWAMNKYLPALAKGDALAGEEGQKVIDQLARYTGLSRDYVRESKLRVSNVRFAKELLRREGRTIGILDSRYKGIDRDSAGEFPDFDPSIQNTVGPYVGVLMDYLRKDLQWETDLLYEYLSEKANESWNWGSARKGYLDVAETLRRAMSKNRKLKVFIANGLYDLDTSYFATRYTIHHLGLDPGLRRNITLSYYEAGHQMYVHPPSLKKLRGEVAEFMKDAVPGGVNGAVKK
jgi:carboxypeptidase C (cathepsin A)